MIKPKVGLCDNGKTYYLDNEQQIILIIKTHDSESQDQEEVTVCDK